MAKQTIRLQAETPTKKKGIERRAWVRGPATGEDELQIFLSQKHSPAA
jgi:hypothetical protein